MGNFRYSGDTFYLNNEVFRVLSGTVQYFRIHPAQWRDRLLKLKACGLNTVETYSCWNLHEAVEGNFDFTGGLDLGAYLDLAAELGLYVIFRPGPYICAEWDMGGLPSWLLTYPGIKLRCSHPVFLEKVRNYLDKIFEIVRPRLISNGGNIIMMQIENEYGAYGDDKAYLNQLKDMYTQAGIDCVLFTCDWPYYCMMNGGKIPGVMSAGNFGSNPKQACDFIKKFAPDQPFFDAELWEGWFDSWFDKEHHTRDAQETADVVAELLDLGGNFNIYIFSGGTNFGFHNGANCLPDKYLPTVTSYDFDGVITEAGDLTPKYYALKKVLEERFGPAPDIPVANSEKRAYGSVPFTEYSSLWENLPEGRFSSWPLSMEEMGQDFGYLVYETEVDGPLEELPMYVYDFKDRAIVYVNGELRGISENMMERKDEMSLCLAPGETAQIRILIENMGRVNFGDKLMDSKGLHGGLHIADRSVFGWKHYSLPMKDISQLQFSEEERRTVPGFLRAEFHVDRAADTFLRLPGLTKGVAFVNGFHIGRYWHGCRLYVPAPLLHTGENELVVFESDSIDQRAAAEFKEE